MSPTMPQKVEISSKTIIFAVFFLIFLKVLYLSRELIYALFIAFIFMSALKPTVNFLEKYKFPHLLAVLVVFFSAIFSIVIALSIVMPPVVAESISFIKNLPTLITITIPGVSYYLNIESLTRFLPDITKNFVKLITTFFSNLIFIVSIVFFTFYFLLEEKFIKNILDKFLDSVESEKIVNILNKVEQRMGAWVRGELGLMTVIGLSTYVGLILLNLPYALPLAIISGILEVVPNIGPILSSIPAFIVGFSISPFTGFLVLLLYIFIQQAENNLIVPLIMRKAVGLNPIMTLIALSIGLKLGGTLGILLSVPVALCVETVLTEVSKLRK